MFRRRFLASLVVVVIAPAFVFAQEADPDKVLDRFVGAWRNEVFRKDAQSPEGVKFVSNEVTAKALRGRVVIGRILDSKSGVKTMWFLRHDSRTNQFLSTYFSTKGLRGTEWAGAWDESAGTLTSKSSDAPAQWTSKSSNRFVTADSVESAAWMKNDQGEQVFDMTVSKKREPDATGKKTLAAWNTDATPAAELSAELKVLDRLAGKWDVTGHAKPAEWTPREETRRSKVERSWVLDRSFLQDTSTGEDGQESISLFTYDPRRREYRSWWFNSEGMTSKSAGQWDAAASTLRTKWTLPEGQTAAGQVHFTDNDHHEWKVVITDAAGKVYFDSEWNCVRSKP